MNTQKTTKLPISVVLIACNEARTLDACLSSLYEWVSQIVLVLNDTTDETEAIAQRYGAEVHHHEWHGFRDQRSLALGYARQPWVLSIDADEVVDAELKASLQGFFQSGDSERYHGASLSVSLFFLGKQFKHGDGVRHGLLRLFRRDSGEWVGGVVHETLRLKNGSIKGLKGALIHHSYQDLEHLMQKTVRYGALFVQDRAHAQVAPSVATILARSLWRFIRGYILRLGFLDGFPGFYFCAHIAFSNLFKYTQLREVMTQQRPPAARAKGSELADAS